MALVAFEEVFILGLLQNLLDLLEFLVLDEEVVAELLELQEDGLVEGQDLLQGQQFAASFQVEEPHECADQQVQAADGDRSLLQGFFSEEDDPGSAVPLDVFVVDDEDVDLADCRAIRVQSPEGVEHEVVNLVDILNPVLTTLWRRWASVCLQK